MPTSVLELELTAGPDPDWQPDGAPGALRALVRVAGRPLGWAVVTGAAASSREGLLAAVGEQLCAPLFAAALDGPEAQEFSREDSGADVLPGISVIVCTRDRTESLESCLAALLALDYPRYEVVVVDNAPGSEATAELARHLPVRYLREEKPGLDWARNRGIAEARYDLVAFADDDTRPDRLWLRALAQAFAAPEVMGVTGLVVPSELATPAQEYFELTYGGMGKGFYRRSFHKDGLKPSGLLWASAFGVGANMAFRRQLFAEVGPFDVALDVGTDSRGGGDIEMLHRAVARGHTLVYEPRAIVWHSHRQDFAALRKQIVDNGCGFGAYLLTCWRNGTVAGRPLLGFVLRQWLGWWILGRLWRPGRHSRRLVVAELMGVLKSPWAYRSARKKARLLGAAGAAAVSA